MNVQEYIKQSCDTGGMSSLSQQIAKELFSLPPFASVVDITAHVNIIGEGKLPYLQQKAGFDLIAAITEFGEKPQLIHALRVINQQVAVSYWYQNHKCGIPLAALPGTSPHERGIAIDIQQHDRWINVLRKHNWIWRGPADPGHFGYHGPSDPDFGQYGIKAFQNLYSKHNQIGLVVDGNFGPKTQTAVLASPIAGWTT